LIIDVHLVSFILTGVETAANRFGLAAQMYRLPNDVANLE